MFLTKDLWQELSTYLFIEKKLSTNKRSAETLRSRYYSLVKYFSTIEFNRKNFNLFILSLQQAGAKPSHLNKYISIAKHVDRFLGLSELTEYTYFHETAEFFDALTPTEIRAIAEAHIEYKRESEYQEIRNKTFIYFLALTGCRAGEALSLKWDDLIHTPIPAAIFRITKNKEVRVVPIRGILNDLLGKLPHRSDLVFDCRDDSWLKLDLDKRVKKAGITKRVWWHLFRHSFVTTMKNSGCSDSTIMRLVGHKSVTTMQRYNQMNVQDLAHEVDAHPLCQENQKIVDISKNMSTLLNRILNKEKYNLLIDESDGQLTVKISSKVYA